MKSFFKSSLLSLGCKLFFLLVHASLASLVDDAFSVAHNDILFLDAVVGHELDASNTCGTSAIEHKFDRADVLLRDLKSVDQASKTHDCGTVLIIVEDWNRHELLQLLLDVEAVW